MCQVFFPTMCSREIVQPGQQSSASPGTFRAKSTPYGAFSCVCPKWHYACLYSGFYGTEFKFSCPNTWKAAVKKLTFLGQIFDINILLRSYGHPLLIDTPVNSRPPSTYLRQEWGVVNMRAQIKICHFQKWKADTWEWLKDSIQESHNKL